MEYTKEYLEKIGLIAERAKFAAALLALSFKWDKTQEGKETWMATYEKLYEMAAAGGADMSDMKPPRKGPSAQPAISSMRCSKAQHRNKPKNSSCFLSF